jgi:hypothetical protein
MASSIDASIDASIYSSPTFVLSEEGYMYVINVVYNLMLSIKTVGL